VRGVDVNVDDAGHVGPLPPPVGSDAPPVVVPEDRRRQHRSTSLSYTLDAYARQAHVIGRVEYSSKGRT